MRKVFKTLFLALLAVLLVAPALATGDVWDVPNGDYTYEEVRIWHPADDGFVFATGTEPNGDVYKVITNGVPVKFVRDPDDPLPTVTVSAIGNDVVYTEQTPSPSDICCVTKPRVVEYGIKEVIDSMGRTTYDCIGLGVCMEVKMVCNEVCLDTVDPLGSRINFQLDSPDSW